MGLLRWRLDADPSAPSGRVGVSMAGQCPRRVAYQLHRYPYTPHPEVDAVRRHMALAVGRAIHDWVRDRIEGVRDREREVRIPVPNAGFDLVGHIDGIVQVDGRAYLLEVKTAGSQGYRAMLANGVEEAYRRQAHTYVYGLRAEGEPIDHVLFLLVDKGSGALTEVVEPYDEALAMDTLQTLSVVFGLPPEAVPRPYAPGPDGRLPWQCAYCSWWAHCWPEAIPLPGPALVVP